MATIRLVHLSRCIDRVIVTLCVAANGPDLCLELSVGLYLRNGAKVWV